LPPEGFFEDDDRDDLITAPLCANCHRPLAKDDEVMRMWMSADIKASAQGKRIFKDKVVGSTIPRSPKLLENIQPFLKRIKIGDTSVVVFSMPQSRAIPFIRRLTKGLLYTLYPNYDYFPDHFSVGYELPNEQTVPIIRKLISTLTPLEKGHGTFRVFHGITADTNDGGAWVYFFYDAVCFVCIHSKRPKFEQQFPAGYSEHSALPKFL
jgi:hypothetical protein